MDCFDMPSVRQSLLPETRDLLLSDDLDALYARARVVCAERDELEARLAHAKTEQEYYRIEEEFRLADDERCAIDRRIDELRIPTSGLRARDNQSVLFDWRQLPDGMWICMEHTLAANRRRAYRLIEPAASADSGRVRFSPIALHRGTP